MNWIRLNRKRRAIELRRKRVAIERRLKTCEVSKMRDLYTLKIENINILLQDMGFTAYPRKG